MIALLYQGSHAFIAHSSPNSLNEA